MQQVANSTGHVLQREGDIAGPLDGLCRLDNLLLEAVDFVLDLPDFSQGPAYHGPQQIGDGGKTRAQDRAARVRKKLGLRLPGK
jgi:hypothetical protein